MDHKENRIGRVAAAYRDPLRRPVYVDRFQSLDPMGRYDLPQPGDYPGGFSTVFRPHILFGLNVRRNTQQIQQQD